MDSFWRRSALYSAYERAHLAGVREAEAVEKCLAGKTWDWPWFDRQAAAFRAAEIWPAVWTAQGIPTSATFADLDERVRAEILSATISAAVYIDRDISNLVNVARDTGWKLELKVSDENCPVEAQFVKTHKAAFSRGRYGALPPYFPGDGTHVRVKR